MARPKGSKNRPKEQQGQTKAPGIAPTLEELSDEQRQSLFFGWKKKYEAALGKKKQADADFKNVCKQARSELGDSTILEIKDAISLDGENTEAAEQALRAEIERKIRVARWMGVEMGAQADLFAAAVEPFAKAYEDGKRAALKGEPAKSPYAEGTADGQDWLKGHHDANDALKQRTDEEVAQAPDNVTTSFSERMRQRNQPEEKRLREQADAMADGEAATA